MSTLQPSIEARYDVILDIELTDNGDHQYVYYQDTGYQIGGILYDILLKLKNGVGVDEIAILLCEERNVTISIEQIHESLEAFIAKITQIKSKRFNDYIKLKVRIVGEEGLEKITLLGQFLFSKNVFVLLFLLSFLLSAGFIIYSVSLGLSSLEWHDNFQKLMLSNQNGLAGGARIIVGIYCIIPFILFFHEIGHASASKRFGISAREIGFGFYFIFPVLYADVTRIWVLNKYRRILVNLGGIYFQLICNVPLIMLLVFNVGGRLLWESLFITNSIIIVFSLNPFLRNDGYWIYSDFFQVPNLMKRSFALPFNLYQRIKKGATNDSEKLEWNNFPLFIYSLANYAFIGYALYYLALYIQSNLVSMADLWNNRNALKINADEVYRLLRFLLSLCLSIYFFYARGKQYYIKLKKKYT